MNKAELIDVVASRIDTSKKDASEAVQAVIDAITETVAKGQKVSISGFGVFERAERAARTYRAPATGEAIRKMATAVPRFRPGGDFKATVNSEKPAAAAKKAAAKATAPAKAAATAATAAATKATAPAKAAAKKATAPAKAAAAKATAPGEEGSCQEGSRRRQRPRRRRPPRPRRLLPRRPRRRLLPLPRRQRRLPPRSSTREQDAPRPVGSPIGRGALLSPSCPAR